MGRIKKYTNKEEIATANKIAAKKYYWKNKEFIDNKAVKKYQKKNGNSLHS